jgi:hypothetical protein
MVHAIVHNYAHAQEVGMISSDVKYFTHALSLSLTHMTNKSQEGEI